MEVKKRATKEEDKAIRRASILRAAANLFLQDHSSLPSVIKIAQASGLAKGTVYLYFKTKEEIFQALLEEQYLAQLTLLNNCIDSGDSFDTLIESLIKHIRANPEFLPLASMSKSVLEQNLMLDCSVDFKRQLVTQFNETADKLEKVYPVFKGKAQILLMRSYAMTLGLWQMLDWPTHLKPLLEEPGFEAFNVAFEEELKASLSLLWSASLSA